MTAEGDKNDKNKNFKCYSNALSTSCGVARADEVVNGGERSAAQWRFSVKSTEPASLVGPSGYARPFSSTFNRLARPSPAAPCLSVAAAAACPHAEKEREQKKKGKSAKPTTPRRVIVLDSSTITRAMIAPSGTMRQVSDDKIIFSPFFLCSKTNDRASVVVDTRYKKNKKNAVNSLVRRRIIFFLSLYDILCCSFTAAPSNAIRR